MSVDGAGREEQRDAAGPRCALERLAGEDEGAMCHFARLSMTAIRPAGMEIPQKYQGLTEETVRRQEGYASVYIIEVCVHRRSPSLLLPLLCPQCSAARDCIPGRAREQGEHPIRRS